MAHCFSTLAFHEYFIPNVEVFMGKNLSLYYLRLTLLTAILAMFSSPHLCITLGGYMMLPIVASISIVDIFIICWLALSVLGGVLS